MNSPTSSKKNYIYIRHHKTKQMYIKCYIYIFIHKRMRFIHMKQVKKFIKTRKPSPSIPQLWRGVGTLRYTELRVKADKALFLEILFGW